VSTKPATKGQIKKAIEAADSSAKFRVFAQGVRSITFYTARNRMAMGTRGASRTSIEQNGRFSVTLWGRDVEARLDALEVALTAQGFVVEGRGFDSLEVHNGTVKPLEGVLTFEGH
jgi:hypothetical protein